MRGDARRWHVREERLLTTHVTCESSKSLVGDCGMDRVPQCRLLKKVHHKLLAQEKNLNSASKVVNWITVDILK